jgi:hypothetical protein
LEKSCEETLRIIECTEPEDKWMTFLIPTINEVHSFNQIINEVAKRLQGSIRYL